MTRCTVQFQAFAEFCKVDLGLKPTTTKSHVIRVRNILNATGPEPTTESIRKYLGTLDNPSTYNNHLKALRAYFRDFKGDDSIIKTFRYRMPDYPMRKTITRADIAKFYDALRNKNDKALFLVFATSGRRFGEIIALTREDIDIEQRVIYPNKQSRTKRTWYSFFNKEAQQHLEELDFNERIFKNGITEVPWAYARNSTGIHITPQDLRFWFANEMRKLGVNSEYVDAFQGRIPRSVLARHYTDYSLENLKRIYDKAKLKVLA